VYWTREPWIHSPHFLQNEDGSLTAEGLTFVNPLTDVPYAPAMAASANGQAKLSWSNTTSAWEAEVEFWVQAPGSGSFVYSKTERVTVAGATETSLNGFNAGYSVKGRVRYFNAYGQADWSSFSDPVVMPPGEQSSKGGPRKQPRICYLPTGIQSQTCN